MSALPLKADIADATRMSAKCYKQTCDRNRLVVIHHSESASQPTGMTTLTNALQ
jgi:hypothetical protein